MTEPELILAPLKGRHLLFAIAYTDITNKKTYQNATQSAIQAEYSETGARQQGMRMLQNVDINGYITEHNAAVSKKSQANASWLLDHLHAIAIADVADIMGDDNTVLPIKQWPLIWRQMINGFDMEFESLDLYNDDGQKIGQEAINMMKKFKTMDRNAVLEKIGKHISVQAFSEKVEYGLTDELMKHFFDLPDTTGLPTRPGKLIEQD